MTKPPDWSPPASDCCLLCGEVDDPTDEHIIPQALWNRFRIDPAQDHLAQYRTILCGRHNQATSALHRRTEVMDLIEFGEPLTSKALTNLADWAVWVTLLLGLARGSGVLGEDASRELLLRRFDSHSGGPPKGARVYAARVSEFVEATQSPPTQYALALVGDSRVHESPAGQPVGYSIRSGPMNASEAIGLGKIALLVVGRTHTSGRGHLERLDDAVSSVGLTRVWPPRQPVPELDLRPISISDVSRLFTVVPLGADMSLMPEGIRALQHLEAEDTSPE